MSKTRFVSHNYDFNTVFNSITRKINILIIPQACVSGYCYRKNAQFKKKKRTAPEDEDE